MKPYYEHAGITIYHGDCREVVREGWWSHLATDPPYGLGRKTHEARAGKQNGAAAAPSRDYGDVSWDEAPADSRWLERLVLASDHAIIWGGNYLRLPVKRGWLVWDKDNGANDYADCELAWTTLDMPIRRLRHRWMGMLQERDEERVHPTQKPLGVMLWAINFLPDGAILDPYMGSGTTLVAAKSLGRKAIGIEIEERYCEIAAKRLAQQVIPL